MKLFTVVYSEPVASGMSTTYYKVVKAISASEIYEFAEDIADIDSSQIWFIFDGVCQQTIK